MLAQPTVVAVVQPAAVGELSAQLRHDYEWKFAACEIRPWARTVANDAIGRIVRNRATYQRVSDATGVPWFLVGVLHQLECDGRFDRRLSDGRPQSATTSWEQSAIDALQKERSSGAWSGIPDPEWQSWGIADILYRAEVYNGTGYMKRGRVSPYVYGGSRCYHRGKYTRDGHFNAHYVSRQVGAATLLKVMLARDLFSMPATTWLQSCEDANANGK